MVHLGLIIPSEKDSFTVKLYTFDGHQNRPPPPLVAAKVKYVLKNGTKLVGSPIPIVVVCVLSNCQVQIRRFNIHPGKA